MKFGIGKYSGCTYLIKNNKATVIISPHADLIIPVGLCVQDPAIKSELTPIPATKELIALVYKLRLVGRC